MSAQHGSVSLNSLHDEHLADRQSAADVIRNGSSPTFLHSKEAIGNNSDASLQVDTRKDAQEKKRERSDEERKQQQEEVARAAQVYMDKFEKLADCPLSPNTQALKDYRDKALKDNQERKEAAEKLRRIREKEKPPAPLISNVEGQRVLREAFCINRLDSIRRMVGNSKLRAFADGKDHSAREEEITDFFKKFMRQNAEDGIPYFCVSAPILGRLLHTFKDDYISRGKATEIDCELTLHVDLIMNQAKESMERMR
jgi:hypothetical protein